MKEEEVAEAEYEDEVVPETSSTTETTKKFIKGGILRPFRSNDDLLATLKRRREQVVTSEYENKYQIQNCSDYRKLMVYLNIDLKVLHKLMHVPGWIFASCHCPYKHVPSMNYGTEFNQFFLNI